MTTELDFAALAAAQPALAAFVTEPRMVVAHTGDGGTFVAWRPFDDEDVHICTLRDKPTRVLLEVVRERDANWGERAVRTSYLLAEGALVPTLDGAHLIINESLLDTWSEAERRPAENPSQPPAPLPDPLPDSLPDETRIDVETLRELSPALAKRAGESVTVAAFQGLGGLSVVTRPALGQTYIYAMGPTEPSLVVRASNGSGDWLDLDRALGIARMLAEGVLTATMGERFLELDDTALTQRLLYPELGRWPQLARFVSSSVFVDGYEGPRGVFVVYRMGSYAGIEFRNVAIVTMRGDERHLVWLLLDDAQSWSDEESACACAWALADGLIGTLDHNGQLVVDEFDADKAGDAF